MLMLLGGLVSATVDLRRFAPCPTLREYDPEVVITEPVQPSSMLACNVR